MKIMATIACIILSTNIGHSQKWDEWFKQKKTQKKYLIQQIAALKVYLGYLKEGYDIAKKGLTIVGDIKEGKFDLDLEYIASLGNVNSAISGSTKVSSIIAYQRLLILEFHKLKQLTGDSDFLTREERNYISEVYANMVRESEFTLHELDRVLSNSDFEMKDDERIQRLDLLYSDMKDKYMFTRVFSNSAELLTGQRAKEQSEIDSYRNLILGL
jgi:hypothetical protein